MGASSDIGGGKLNDIDMIELTGKIMVLAVFLLFFLGLFFFSHHLYARLLRHRPPQNTTTATTTTTRRRRRLDFAAGYEEITIVPCTRLGLDARVLKTIPVVTFDPNEFKDGLECAVCLCEVSEGENARILPKCNHGFHVECIDMWFHSHSTCPLCRNPVSDQKHAGESTLGDTIQAPLMAENSTEAQSFPTNVYGPCMDQEDRLDSPISESSMPSSSSTMALTSNRLEGMVVIDIPGTTD